MSWKKEFWFGMFIFASFMIRDYGDRKKFESLNKTITLIVGSLNDKNTTDSLIVDMVKKHVENQHQGFDVDGELTKNQAIDAMIAGYKVRHRLFTDTEWMAIDGDDFVFEDESSCTATEFWMCRDDDSWEDGWTNLGKYED